MFLCLKVFMYLQGPTFMTPLPIITLPFIPQCHNTILILSLVNSSTCALSSCGKNHPHSTGLVAKQLSIGKSSDRAVGSKQLSFQKMMNVFSSLLGKAFV